MEPMSISKVDMIRLQSWFNNPNQAGKNNVAIPGPQQLPPAPRKKDRLCLLKIRYLT